MLKFKEHIIKKKIEKLQQTLDNRSMEIKPVKTVAILNNPKSNLTFDNLKYLQKALGLSSSQFDIFTFKEKNDHYNELRGIVASKDIFSTFGKIKTPEILEFLDKKYDLLIDFTGQTTLYEQFFSLTIKANFRIGYMHPGETYDLMLNVPQGDIKKFADETARYLKIIGLL